MLGGELMVKPKKALSFLPKQKPTKEKTAQESPVRSIRPLATLIKPQPKKTSGGIFDKLRRGKGGRS
jgi:hypothetical protein